MNLVNSTAHGACRGFIHHHTARLPERTYRTKDGVRFWASCAK